MKGWNLEYQFYKFKDFDCCKTEKEDVLNIKVYRNENYQFQRRYDKEGFKLILAEYVQFFKKCDDNCKFCNKCGLWAVSECYFISCSEIWKLDID